MIIIFSISIVALLCVIIFLVVALHTAYGYNEHILQLLNDQCGRVDTQSTALAALASVIQAVDEETSRRLTAAENRLAVVAPASPATRKH